MSDSTTKRVCVTGASGFVASALVRLLLSKGYHVRGTVRDPSNATKTAHLTSLPGADERLELVQAKDLLEEGAFDEAVKGVDGVFHTASPFFFSGVTDPEAQLLRPAEQGTLNVLRSIDKAGTKPRVVLTSSIAAIYVNPDKKESYSEEDWSDETYCREKSIWYPLSKTLAEKAAWSFVEALPEDRRFALATVNPVLVVGEMLQPTLNTSSEMVLAYLNGTKKAAGPVKNINWNYVDNEDVAALHLAVYENSEATGRHLASASEPATTRDLLAALRKVAPEYTDNIPTELSGDEPGKQELVNAKARAVGVEFTGLEETLRRTVESLKKHGFLGESAVAVDGAGAGAGSA